MGQLKRRPMTAGRVLRGFKRIPNLLEKAGYTSGLTRTDPRLLPDFLVIGFRKSGSTWLHENLLVHPEVYMGERKGVRYFDRKFSGSVAGYLEHFRDADGRVKGEVTPGYVTIPEPRIWFLRRLMPRVKLVLLLRNPVEQEWARVVHDIRKTGREPDAVPEREILERFERSRVHRAGGFVQLILRWERMFSPEQLYIGLFDDIEHRPKQLLSEVFEHIGVSTDVNWEGFPFDRVIIPPVLPELRNRTPGRGISMSGYRSSSRCFPAKYRTYLSHRYGRDLEIFHAALGERVAHWDHPPVKEDPSPDHVATRAQLLRRWTPAAVARGDAKDPSRALPVASTSAQDRQPS